MECGARDNATCPRGLIFVCRNSGPGGLLCIAGVSAVWPSLRVCGLPADPSSPEVLRSLCDPYQTNTLQVSGARSAGKRYQVAQKHRKDPYTSKERRMRFARQGGRTSKRVRKAPKIVKRHLMETRSNLTGRRRRPWGPRVLQRVSRNEPWKPNGPP